MKKSELRKIIKEEISNFQPKKGERWLDEYAAHEVLGGISNALEDLENGDELQIHIHFKGGMYTTTFEN